jgi:hypothetical protein
MGSSARARHSNFLELCNAARVGEKVIDPRMTYDLAILKVIGALEETKCSKSQSTRILPVQTKADDDEEWSVENEQIAKSSLNFFRVNFTNFQTFQSVTDFIFSL